MQDFLRPDHVTPLKAGPSPSSALRHLVSLAVLPHGPAIPREVPAGGRVSVSWNAPQAGCRAPPSRQNNQRLMEQQWDWRFKKFKLNCTEQRDPSASYQIYSHSFYTGDNNNSKNCTPFPVPPLYQLSVIFRQCGSTQLPCEQSQPAAAAVTQQLEHAAHAAAAGTAAMCYSASGLGQLNICFPQGNDLCCISLREKKLVYFIFHTVLLLFIKTD